MTIADQILLAQFRQNTTQPTDLCAKIGQISRKHVRHVCTMETSRRHNWGQVIDMSRNYRLGATENAGVENAGVSKIQGWKSREWKSRHQNAGGEKRGRNEYGKPKFLLFNIVTSGLQQPIELM